MTTPPARARTEALHDGWTLTATDGDLPAAVAGRELAAQVPGTVHVDLLAAGLVPDPYLEANEAQVAWLHRSAWRYRRPLRLEPAGDGERVDLVLEGVDTVADVRLGDELLGSPRNMHRSYRYDVRHLADGAERDLVVDVASATAYAEGEAARLGPLPNAYPTPFNYVRKMACSFGWDWGPDLRTSGLWKPVLLHRWRTARLARVRPLVSFDDADPGTGVLDVRVDVERSGLEDAGPLRVRVDVLGQSATGVLDAGRTAAAVVVRVPDAPVWWPVGMGAQPLADVVVTLLDGLDGLDSPGSPGSPDALDVWQRRVGFRTVALDTAPDEHGAAFTLSVNGRPVFVRGANWIPDDHLLTRVTRERLAQRLDQALGANLNLLRVWGGGIYESEDFYELADERGLMVWQDFLLACAAYPEEEPLASELEAEARENVARLVPHPSLVLWNGGNENVWGYQDWGWKEQAQGRTWGGRYAHELLRGVVAHVDPTRPYCDNSPCSPGYPTEGPGAVHPNDPDHGTHHEWEVWNRRDWAHYRDEVPRFCSEFGFQGPPTAATLAEAVHAVDGGSLEDAADPLGDPVWLVHQKADDGNGKLDRGMAPHVGVPASFTDWTWAAQLVQARAVQYALEHYRSWWPRTAGAVVWQLNDCWPVTSWAAVDGAGRPKPLWYAMRRAFAPRVLSFVHRDGDVGDELVVAVVNDTDEAWAGPLAVRRETLGGERLAAEEERVDVAPRSVHLHRVGAAVAAPGDTRAEAVVAELGGVTAVHTFVEDVDLALDPDAAQVSVERADDWPGGLAVRVRARSLVKDLCVLADRVHPDAVADDGMVTLPAGAEHVVRVTCPPLGAGGDAALAALEAFAGAPVLRTANDLRAAPQTTRVVAPWVAGAPGQGGLPGGGQPLDAATPPAVRV